MSRRDPGGVSFVRTILSAILVVDLVSFFFFLGAARVAAIDGGVVLNGFDDFFSRALVRAVVVLIGAGGAIEFGRRPGRLWEGTLALAALIVLSSAHAQLFGSPWRHLYFSGLCLAGWLAGLAVARRRGTPGDESFARTGSIALLGAAYLNAGISKMIYGGVDWITGTPIQFVILGQDGLVTDGLVSTYRSWVATTPSAASLFAVATMVFELAAPLLLAGRRVRACVALGLCAMHLNIYVLTHILYWESMVLLLLFGLSPDPPSAGAPLEGAVASRFRGRNFAAASASLAVFAFFAIQHQAGRYARVQQRKTAGTPPAPASEPQPTVAAPSSATPGARSATPAMPTPTLSPTTLPSATPPFRAVGPLTVGQGLTESWSVQSIEITESGFTVTLSGKPGIAKFEVTCAPSEHQSPFDLGRAHIFYFNTLPFSELEAAGRALQTRLRDAAKDGDVCKKVEFWRSTAQRG